MRPSRAVPGADTFPGTVESLGGRLVHRLVQPGTQPPVVLLGGCGVPYYMWNLVTAGLGGRELVRMDRPGLVGTPWPGVLPRLSSEVDTLVDLLRGLSSPALVVAHSMAGLHAEALIRQHPELVRGLVLADTSVEWEPKPRHGERYWLLAARAMHRLPRVPPLRFVGSLTDRVMTTAQSRRLRWNRRRPAMAVATYRAPDAVASVIAESAAYESQILDLAVVRTDRPFPAIPVRVLTAAADGGHRWVAAQARLAEELGGTQVIADDSRHLIMVDRPDLVISAILAVEAESRPA
jgi:poly(3-hydroxyoctanoate) depolymerase